MLIKYSIGGITPQLGWHILSQPILPFVSVNVLKKVLLAHIWWTCLKVCRLWIGVCALLHNLFHTNLKRDPFEALLCKPISELLCPERQLAFHLFTATKLTIARAWKTLVLSFEAIKNHMNDIMVNKKLTAMLSDTHDKFLRVWQPWVAYVKPSRFDAMLLSIRFISGPHPVDSPSFLLFFLLIFLLCNPSLSFSRL